MTTEERDRRIAAGLAEHKADLENSFATPVLCVGVGHAPGPLPGKWTVSLAARLPLEEAYRIITSIQEELAARLGVL